LDQASDRIRELQGHELDVLSLRKPLDADEALGWAKIVSKLSPILGNLFEFEIVRLLNDLDLPPGLEWVRQDPGFPDAALLGFSDPPPGIEIKAWFPLATEITGRFRESRVRLLDGSVRLAVVCWLPEYVIFGKPVVVGTFVADALSLAEARDTHYFRPPLYLVQEPGDTSQRTVNLQQTITNGFRCQETPQGLAQAQAEVDVWPDSATTYSHETEVQDLVQSLLSRFSYRLDTNFAKIDRIEHEGLETFKAAIMATEYRGKTILDWRQGFARNPTATAGDIMALAAAAP
jgi:hypothetical protein